MQLTHKDYLFLIFAFILCFGIGAFSFWLGFPGYLGYDTMHILDFNISNWAPVTNTLFIGLFSLIFGKHTFYVLLWNLITLYLGIWFLIAGFYLRYKSVFALFPLCIVFVGNIYLSNFVALNYILMANFIFCAYSVILFLILTGGGISKRLKIALWILIFLLLFLGLLWRHNAIFSAFPAFFIIAYLLLKDLDSTLWRYASFIALSAILCVSLAIELPKMLSKPYLVASKHLYLLQIAGACVPANDASCFDDEWYIFEGIAVAYFDKVKKAYNGNPMDGDLYLCQNGIFECGKLKGLKSAWIRAILKHPHNFLAHESRFFKTMWWQNPRDDDEFEQTPSVIKPPQIIQEAPNDFKRNILQKWGYPQNEWHITFSQVRERIYTALYNHLPVLNHAIFIAVGFALLIFSTFEIFRVRKQKSDKSLLIFTFATALTTFASAFIIAAMAIVTHSRYMSPVPIFSVIALVGFVAFVLDYLSRKKVNL